ncbi:MAG: hypothetical protein HY961_02675 [Ignavibacteriae bacterium]|nr:hypothetical protein [Ignavibacteriota bacterium]
MIRFPELLLNRTFVRILYVFVAAFVFAVWVWTAETPITSFNGDPHSKLSDLIYGAAHKPYVQRALIPILTRSVYSIIPENTWSSLEENLLAYPKVGKELARLGWENEFLAEYMIALTFAFLALTAFPFVVRGLWDHLYETADSVKAMVPILTLLLLPTLFSSGPHYIYDFPALLFFTLGFLLLLKRRWTIYYPIFIIGCINKETIIILTLAYVIVCGKTEARGKLALHLGLQMAAYLIIKTAISYAFRANPGSAMEFHVFGNIHILLLGYDWSSVLIVGITAALLFHDFHTKPELLRRSLILVAVFGALVFFFGVIPELRAFYEVVPIVAFLGLHTIFFSYLRQPYRIKQIV